MRQLISVLLAVASLGVAVGSCRRESSSAPLDAADASDAAAQAVGVLPVATSSPTAAPRPRRRLPDAGTVGRINPPDPRIEACSREATDKASLMQCLSGVHEEPRADAGHRYGAVRPSFPCTAQSVSAWWINPSTGSDDNSCTSSSSPCKTYGEITARWGCGGSPTTSPAPTGATTITLMASQSGTSDRVIFSPILNEGSSAYFTCQWSQIATGTFASVTPSIAAAGVADGRWKADLGSGATGLLGTRGLFVVDTTRSSSVAAVQAVISGTQVALTQPFASNAPVAPSFPVLPAENSTWATGDTWQLMQLPTMFVSDFSPTVPQTDSSSHTVFAFLEHCLLGDASGTPGGDSITFGQGVAVTESEIDSTVSFQGVNSARGATIFNTAIAGSADLGVSFLVGGWVNGLSMENDGFVDGDTIIANDVSIAGPGGLFGSVNAFNSDIDVFSKLSIAATNYAANRIYGTYTMDVSGSSETAGQPGASLAYTTSASSTFLGVPTWQVDHQTTACAHDTAHQQAPPICGITVSDATIDAAVASGGFGGVVYGYGNSVVAPTRLPTISAPSSTWLQAGSGIGISQSPGGAAVISSTAVGGVSSVSGGTGIACSPTTGNVTCTNAGIITVNGGPGVSCIDSGGTATCSNTGVTSIAPGIGLSATASTGDVTINLQTPVGVAKGGTGFTACPSGDLVTGGTTSLGCVQPSTLVWPSCKGGSAGFAFTNDSTGPHVLASVSFTTPNDGISHTVTCHEAMQASVSMDDGVEWQVDHGFGVATSSSFTSFADFQIGAGGGNSLDQSASWLMTTTLPANTTTTINAMIEVVQVSDGLQGATYSGQMQASCCLTQ